MTKQTFTVETAVAHLRSLLLDSPGCADLFDAVFSSLESVRNEDGNLFLSLGKNKAGEPIAIEVATPALEEAVGHWPESLQRVFLEHSGFGIWEGDNCFGGQLAFDTRCNHEALRGTPWEAADYDLFALRAPISGGCGTFVYHPAQTTLNGEPVLCRFYDDEIGEPLSFGPGSIFIWMVATYLQLDPPALVELSSEMLMHTDPPTASGVLKAVALRSGLSLMRIGELEDKRRTLLMSDLRDEWSKSEGNPAFLDSCKRLVADFDAYREALPGPRQEEFSSMSGYALQCYRDSLSDLISSQ